MEPKRWYPFLALVLLIGLILRQPVLMILALIPGFLILFARWWNHRVLRDLIYRRRPYYRRGFPDETIDLRIEIENRKLLPVSWLRTSDLVPEAVGPVDKGELGTSHLPRVGVLLNVISLRWFEKIRRHYRLLLRERGVYTLGPVSIESGDIFGFYETSKQIKSNDYLTVFPRMVPFEDIPLPTEDPFGELKTQRRLYEDPNLPMGVRDYLPEDDFRRVHWPATARLGQLQSKVYQPVSAHVMVICLNISTYSHHWEGTNRALLEYAIGITTSLVVRGSSTGYQIGLISNGSLAKSDQPFRIAPARSTRHLAAILEALAAVTPLITSPFERFLVREVPRLPYGASLMIVTAFVTPGLEETIIRLRKSNRRITLLSLEKEPPRMIPGIRCLHAPFSPGSPQREVGIQELLGRL